MCARGAYRALLGGRSTSPLDRGAIAVITLISILCILSVALGVISAMIRRFSFALFMAIAIPIVLCFLLARLETTPNTFGTRNGWDVVFTMLGAVFAVPGSLVAFAITRWFRRRRQTTVVDTRGTAV